MPFSSSWLPGHHETNSHLLSSLCHQDVLPFLRPKVMEPAADGLKPLKPQTKTSLVTFSVILLGACGERRRSWVSLCCYHGHGHVKDPIASGSGKMAKPSPLVHVWVVCVENVHHSPLPPAATARYLLSEDCCPSETANPVPFIQLYTINSVPFAWK